MGACKCKKALDPQWAWRDCYACWRRTTQGRTATDVRRRLEDGQRWSPSLHCWIRGVGDAIKTVN